MVILQVLFRCRIKGVKKCHLQNNGKLNNLGVEGERGQGGRSLEVVGEEVKIFRFNCNLLKQSKTYYALCITFGTRGCDVGINIL